MLFVAVNSGLGRENTAGSHHIWLLRVLLNSLLLRQRYVGEGKGALCEEWTVVIFSSNTRLAAASLAPCCHSHAWFILQALVSGPVLRSIKAAAFVDHAHAQPNAGVLPQPPAGREKRRRCVCNSRRESHSGMIDRATHRRCAAAAPSEPAAEPATPAVAAAAAQPAA